MKVLINTFVFFLLFLNNVFSQKIVVLDADSQDLLLDVSYKMFLNRKLIVEQKCETDEATLLPESVVFDSVFFEKNNYEVKRFAKNEVPQVVYLIRKTTVLDEIIIEAKKNAKDTILGEKNKFHRKADSFISEDVNYVLNCQNPFNKEIKIKAFRFFVEKVKVKTAFRISLYSYEKPKDISGQFLLKESFLMSDIQYLNVNQEGEVIVNLSEEDWKLPLGDVWMGVELVEYVDQDNNRVFINEENKTKIKFQFSQESNYFAKMSNFYSGELTKGLFNINGRIKYDFAIKFFKKPHKSNLVAPVYFLEVERPIVTK